MKKLKFLSLFLMVFILFPVTPTSAETGVCNAADQVSQGTTFAYLYNSTGQIVSYVQPPGGTPINPCDMLLDPMYLGGSPWGYQIGSYTFVYGMQNYGQPVQDCVNGYATCWAFGEYNFVISSIAITTTSLPQPREAVAYSQTLQTTGGTLPFVWSVDSGALPDGLSLNSSTGEISGIPMEEGVFNFTVRVTDADTGYITRDFSLNVLPEIIISSPAFLIGDVNLPYSRTIEFTGGIAPFSWSVIFGSLPAGLFLNSSTGEISGTPSLVGGSNFTLQLNDSGSESATQTFHLEIYSRNAETGVCNAADQVSQGTTFAYLYNSTGQIVSYVQPPGGTPINPCDMLLDPMYLGGSPWGYQIGSYTFVYGMQNYGQPVQDCVNGYATCWAFGEYNFVINPDPVITTNSLVASTVGGIYSQALQSFGGTAPLTWSVASGSLPAGLSLNSSTGVISGSPTTLGISNFTVQVTDANNQIATKDLSITVHGDTPAGTNVSVSDNGVDLTFSAVTQEGETSVTTSSGGQPPPTGFKLGNPPTYYNISTTATFTGTVEICITWTQGQFNNENNLKLFHFDGTNWVNITTSLDTVNNVICGLTTSFSDFAIFEKKQVVASIDIKPGNYPNSINLGSNGTVPVAIFSTSTFDARTIDPLTVTLASAPVQLRGNGTSMSSVQDVNGDGLLDLVVHVTTEALQLSSTDQMADLVGYTLDSTEVIGSDTVRVLE